MSVARTHEVLFTLSRVVIVSECAHHAAAQRALNLSRVRSTLTVTQF